MWIYNITSDNFEYISSAATEFFGYPESEWSNGARFSDTLIHPDDLERYWQVAREVLDSATDRTVDWRARLADGAQAWVRSEMALLPSEDESLILVCHRKVDGFGGADKDLDLMFQQAPDGLMSMAPDRTIEAVNPRLTALLDLPERQLVGRDVLSLEILSEQTRDRFREVFESVSETGHSGIQRVRLRDGDEERFVDVSASRIDAFDRDFRVLASFRDVTDHVLAQREEERIAHHAMQSERIDAIGRLSSGVAHDFNNLLTVIMTHTSLLIEEENLNEQAKSDLAEIEAAARQSARMTGQLLAFGRMQILSPKPLSTRATLAEVARVIERLVPDRVEVVVECLTDISSFEVDPKQFEGVMINLAINASEAMPDGGCLTIRALEKAPTGIEGEQEYVCIQVSDEGNGISPSMQGKVFEPFFTTKESGYGSGLGLSTVHGVIKQSGGHIEVESAPGQGATFSIFLPRSEVPVEATMAHDKTSETESSLTDRILIVEDQKLVLRAAARILKSEGFEVYQAQNLGEAQNCLESAEIDVVLCDVNLDLESGLEILPMLQERGLEAPVIFMSGDPASADPRLAEQLFLEKPFSRDSLIAAISGAAT